MAGLFGRVEKKYKWDVNLSEEMKHTEKVYAAYILYFRQFRQIRHDFANYVQGIALDESEIDREIQKKRKQKLMEQLDSLLFALCGRIAVLAAGQNIRGQELWPDFDDFAEMGEEKARRWKSWLEKKKYFIQLEKELPHMKEVLMALKERLTGRLELDEREIGEYLSDLDGIEGLVDMDNPVIAVLFTDMLSVCKKKGVEFRFKLEMSEDFQLETMDLYYLCDRMLHYALEKADEKIGYQEEKQKQEPVTIRFGMAAQFGIWHMQIECPQSNWQSIPSFGNVFTDILKKYKISYKTQIKNEAMQIHLIR